MSLFSSDDIAGGPYLLYKVRSRYVWDAHILSLPVAYQTAILQSQAGPGYTLPFANRQAAEVIKTAAEQGWRLVTFDLVRWGGPPKLPDPTPLSNETLGRAEIEVDAPLLQADGITYIWSARGFYLYALAQPPWAKTEQLRTGATPASTDIADGNETVPEQFVTGLK